MTICNRCKQKIEGLPAWFKSKTYCKDCFYKIKRKTPPRRIWIDRFIQNQKNTPECLKMRIRGVI